MPVIQYALGILAVIVAFVFLALLFSYGRLWINSIAAGAGIGLVNLFMMSLRRVNPSVIVRNRIAAVKAGLSVTTDEMEAHWLAGGDVQRVVEALIAATKADIPLTWKAACAIDLAGRDIKLAVQTSVYPKVIDAPDPAKGKDTIDAVAKDGIQLRAKARVTVRTNLERLVGGATEETIIARVGEAIVTAIGSAETHKEILKSPDLISKRALEKGLDAGTAFEILSIDVAYVLIGENIGAKLQADQAEADKRVAQAIAEGKRVQGIAREAEMNAMIAENRSKVVLAEAEIPKAISQAFREGNLGIMDYYRLRNIQADTDMRSTIAGTTERKPTPPPTSATP
jgi:uncharacterized protein YqfA (UPF0365 family)